VKLIGMLDSPYVRRVAISLKLMRTTFSHEAVSVFSEFAKFATINPVVKAPTLVTDEGVVLMDSTLILEYVERLVPSELRLAVGQKEFPRAQRLIGLALAGCEKTVQAV
jgi:glutathione S-transferase